MSSSFDKCYLFRSVSKNKKTCFHFLPLFEMRHSYLWCPTSNRCTMPENYRWPYSGCPTLYSHMSYSKYPTSNSQFFYSEYPTFVNLVCKRTLNHLAKLTILVSSAKWLSVRLRSKWFWGRVQLQSLIGNLV